MVLKSHRFSKQLFSFAAGIKSFFQCTCHFVREVTTKNKYIQFYAYFCLKKIYLWGIFHTETYYFWFRLRPFANSGTTGSIYIYIFINIYIYLYINWIYLFSVVTSLIKLQVHWKKLFIYVIVIYDMCNCFLKIMF